MSSETKLKVEAIVMSVDEAAARAVKTDLSTASSAQKAHQAEGAAPAKAPSAAPSGGFTSSGTDRQVAFVGKASEFDLSSDDAMSLYAMMLGSRPDVLTGFERAGDREETVKKAATHVEAAGVAAMYVEIDIRNLGGLNAKLGKAKTDVWFLKMTSMAEDRMATLSRIATALPFRHGGDEFSFVVVAKTKQVDQDQLEREVVTALIKAAGDIAQATRELSWIEHSKNTDETPAAERRPPGTGIVWGTSVIHPGDKPTTIFSAADKQVERKKVKSASAGA